MPPSEKCPHDPQLTPASCAECMYEGNVTPPRVTVDGRPWTAKYSGTCALCDQQIEPGDLIFGRSDGSYIHYRHAPSPRRTR